MSKTKRLLVLLLAIAFLFTVLGCESKTTEPDPTVSSTTEAPTEPPVSSRYTQAAQVLRDAKDLSIEQTCKKTIATGIETLIQESERELILTGIGTEDLSARLTEEVEIDTFGDEIEEFYDNGILYVKIGETGLFKGKLSEEAFLERLAPAALLDETLYGDVTFNETETGVKLTFSDPSGPESWALPSGAEFLSASGTARISNSGALVKTTYTIEYATGNTTISEEFSSEAEIYDDAALEAPSEPDRYQNVMSIQVPRLYRLAVLYLYSTHTASSKVTESIISQAAGYMLTKEAEFHYTGTAKDHASEIRYEAVSMDGSSVSETFSQTESYKDGVYTCTTDGNEPETDPEITALDMYTYLQEFYEGNVPHPTYITDAKVEDVAGLLYLEMELSEEWGENVSDTLNYSLFGDTNYLNDYASAYKTAESGYCIVLNPITGFPVSAGTTYSGIHTIEGSDYVLSRSISQTFQLANPNTYETLRGETAPDEQATPLLYHVTGSDGHEMYLMGTIHVGDARTAFLPDEVYHAFEASDSLAVELDITMAEESLKTDPELLEQYTAACINKDGAVIKDILDADTYKKAVQLLKASGSYSANMEYMKPFMWDSTIGDFYLSLGDFSSDKGMDMRLLKLAKEQDKPILEVESLIFQMEMEANFSTELQILMLETSLNGTAAEYNDALTSTYELWCSGDEAALREMLKEETTDLSDAELTLYEEYLDAMIIQRNKNMLDVAISYLESDETVFYAVGLAHLLQENGLVDTLQEAGYTVEKVIYK